LRVVSDHLSDLSSWNLTPFERCDEALPSTTLREDFVERNGAVTVAAS
jgi:hypothetical protein